MDNTGIILRGTKGGSDSSGNLLVDSSNEIVKLQSCRGWHNHDAFLNLMMSLTPHAQTCHTCMWIDSTPFQLSVDVPILGETYRVGNPQS